MRVRVRVRVSVECAKCRRECDLSHARATLCGDRVVVDLEEENWRLCSTTVVRGVSGELEDENWRLGSTT